MSKLIRLSLGVDVDHNLIDFPINVYTGTTSGDTTNWSFTETPILTFESVTTSPIEFYVEDELLSFGLRLEGQGCHLQDLFIESPRVDCEICGDFVEYYPPQPTPNPTPNPTPSSTPNPTLEPTNTPTRTPNPQESYYRIQDCINSQDFHAPKDMQCQGGNFILPINTYSVGDVVQFIYASAGCGSATYCGTIIDTNFQASPDSETAYISREAPVPDCEDIVHCAQ